MHAHFLQHVHFEGLGSIKTWLEQNQYTITRTTFFDSDNNQSEHSEWGLPDIGNIDLLIVMGGPMSVHDVESYPWLSHEIRFIQEAILAEVPVLGICLGAQLIALAMGAEVLPNKEKEIGWFPLKRVVKNRSIFQFPEVLEVFHWHGETFELPKGAILLAESDACTNQAFAIGKRVVGLQFHLETTPESARAIVANCGNELVSGPFIQTESQILSKGPETYRKINKLMSELLTYITAS